MLRDVGRPGTPAMPELQKVHYTHDAMIDLLIARPDLSQGEVAAIFQYTQSWLSIIINSDAFKERLAARKAELVDPRIMATVDDRLNALASKSAEVLLDRLNTIPDTVTALKALDISSRALGYGARVPQVQVNNIQPVAVEPAKELNSGQWMTAYAPGRPVEVVDVEVSRADT